MSTNSTVLSPLDVEAPDPFREQVSEAECLAEEAKFCDQLVAEIRKFWHKSPTDAISLQDFFYKMHRIEESNSYDVTNLAIGWSMSTGHWIAITMHKTYLYANHAAEFSPAGVFTCYYGSLVVYSDEQVSNCIRELAAKCISHGHEINSKARGAE